MTILGSLPMFWAFVSCNMTQDEAQAAKRVAQLQGEIEEHNRRYYEEAAPTVSDREYDRLYEELVNLETKFPRLVSPDSPTQRVGGKPLKAFEPVRHRVPMLSLDNTYSEKEVADFYARVTRLLPNEKIPVVIEPKVDGVAVSLMYEDGKLRYAATRGDGFVGDDITQNIKTIRSVPERLRGKAPKILEVRGEVFMDKQGFEKLNRKREEAGRPLFANPRNAAAGSLKQLDPKIVAERPLGVVFYGTGATQGLNVELHSEVFPLLSKFGLPATERWWLGNSFEDISRATLHNEDEIKRKDIRIGDTVVIEKAGEVIPAVVAVVKAKRPRSAKPFDFLEHIGGKCPVCGGAVRRDPEFVAWRCENLQCPAQTTRRVEFFAARSALDIESIGGIVADKLVERGLVREPLDLFELNVEQLAKLNLATEEAPRVFGEKNATKAINTIERARTLPLSRWLFALAIPDVGKTTATQLGRFHDTIRDVANSQLLRDVVDYHQKREQKESPQQITDRLIKAGFAERSKGKSAKHGIVTEVGPVVARSVLDFFASSAGKNIL